MTEKPQTNKDMLVMILENQFVFDTDGEKIIENVRGDNSLLFKAF